MSSADITVYTPVLEFSLIRSYLLWGEFSICALCCSHMYSQSLQFSFLVPPGTHLCWVDRGSMVWEVCLTPQHMAGSITRTLVSKWRSPTQVLTGLGVAWFQWSDGNWLPLCHVLLLVWKYWVKQHLIAIFSSTQGYKYCSHAFHGILE